MTDGKHEIIPAQHAIDRGRMEEEADPIASSAMDMLRANPTPETADKILDFLERLRATHARESFARSMIALKQSLPPVLAKNKKHGHLGHNYASLDNVMQTIRPALSKNGFDVSWKTKSVGKDIVVICRLLHADGHFEECETPPAPPDVGKGRNTVQAIGSTMTYLSRYSLLLLLGLATSDAPDPDDGGERDPGSIDANRNIRALIRIKKAGLSREQAEGKAGKPVEEWTEADLKTLWSWSQEYKALQQEALEDEQANSK